MAGDTKKLQPIIVKRIKKGAHGHHGGAWKIAYADFVTAMMAFFLLMWLLGSTTEGDKKGIADYFNSPLKVAFFGGSGAGDASHVIKGGGKDLTQMTGQVKSGTIKDKKKTYNLLALKASQAAVEAQRLHELKSKVEKAFAAESKLAPYRGQIRLDMIREGLRIQIVDDQNRAMFDSGSAVVKDYMRDILQTIGGVLNEVPNRVTIEGHTDAQTYSSGDRGYSNWELSADRANASRRELVAGGLSEKQILRVQGLAASSLFDKDNPTSALNRRISIIVMKREAEDEVFQANQAEDAASDAVLGQPTAPADSSPMSLSR